MSSRHSVKGNYCYRLGHSPDAIKANAKKKIQGDQEVDGHRKKVTVRVRASHTFKTCCSALCHAYVML